MNNDHHKVSSTAVTCAGARALFTKMPYAKDVFREMLEDRQRKGIRVRAWAMKSILRIPFVLSRLSKVSVLEGRHNANNEALSRLGADIPILEIAAGLSTRGLELGTTRVYVETDLPDVLEQKKTIAEAILKKRRQGISGNHLFLSANALDYDQLKTAAQALRKLEPTKPFALIHEGLLMFLNDEEQTRFRDNIRRLFNELNPDGWWITTDFSFQSDKYFSRGYRKHVEKGTGRSFNSFASDEEIVSFLNEGGLNVDLRCANHIARELSCIHEMGLKLDSVMKYADQYRAAVITLG